MSHRANTDAVATYLEQVRGAPSFGELSAATSRRAVERAIAEKRIVVMGRGRYVLADVAELRLGRGAATHPWVARDAGSDATARAGDDAGSGGTRAEGVEDAEDVLIRSLLAIAGAHRGALSHRCAAIAHRWPLLEPPARVELVLPRGRAAARVSPVDATVRLRPLSSEEREQHCTSPVRTVIDCARELPFREALAIADAALASGEVGQLELIQAADECNLRGVPKARRVVAHANGGAANPHESALRAILLGCRGLTLHTQYRIRDAHGQFAATVDVADPELGIVFEANGYEFHGSKERYDADLRRYAQLTALGWTVLPFAFSATMERPAWVREQVEAAMMWRRRFRARPA